MHGKLSHITQNLSVPYDFATLFALSALSLLLARSAPKHARKPATPQRGGRADTTFPPSGRTETAAAVR